MHRGEVSGHEVTRMIFRDGQSTSLGQAIAHYGRIFKTLHILRLAESCAWPMTNGIGATPWRRRIFGKAVTT
ncbi:Tn3 family transposase [Nocardia gamkensis]|uniref:Tn3 family transposase n=1 Tax=Nocardia gamkensis TaxID=352869 RepID=UPI0033C358F0